MPETPVRITTVAGDRRLSALKASRTSLPVFPAAVAASVKTLGCSAASAKRTRRSGGARRGSHSPVEIFRLKRRSCNQPRALC
jgi:hypothetical protein